MKQFLKFTAAACIGTILALGLILLICIGIGAVSGKKDAIKSGTFITFDLNRVIPEKTDNVASNNQFSFEYSPSTGLYDINRTLQKAAKDPNIEGIILKSTFTGNIGNAKAVTLLKYLNDFKDSGKKIYAYGDFVGQNEYLPMLAADSIFCNPLDNVDFRGMSTSVPFFKELMDKVGVDMNIFYVGNFKSATEPFRRNNMSEYSKQQSRELLTDLERIYLDTVAVYRDVSATALRQAQKTYSVRDAEDAKNLGLVDGVAYWEEFLRLWSDDEDKPVKTIAFDDYVVRKGKASKPSGKDKIAIVYAEGEIQYNTKGPGNICEIDYHKVFDKIEDRNDVKAVVLRVNSPGGSAFTSEHIWHRIERIKAKGIPVVASYGNYAASGGYYISCAADKIVTQPNTITGSIGVFGMFPDASKLLNEKLGIHLDTVKTAPYASAMSPFFALQEGEKEIIQSQIDDMYDKFITRVADGRNMSKAEVQEVAQGRVWSGVQAVNNGLADELGDIDDAIRIAAEMADLDKYGVREYPQIEENFLNKMIKELSVQAKIQTPYAKLTPAEKQVKEQYDAMKHIIEAREPMMLLPFTTI